MRAAGTPYRQLWLVALLATAIATALVWLGPINRTQSRIPSAPVTASGGDTAAAPQVGQPVPDFELADIDGNAVRFSAMLGRPVVINFWATWCAPCRAEMPLLQAFFEEQSDSRLMIIGIDAGEPVETVRQFLNDYGITYPVWVDPPNTQPPGNATLSLFKTLRAIGLPTTYFVDASGHIAETHLGEIDRPTLEEKTRTLLESNSEEAETARSAAVEIHSRAGDK